MLHPNRLASARLLSADVVEQDHPHKDGAFWLGRSPFNNGQIAPDGLPLGMKDDRHFLLVGGTRGGKGTGFIVPNLCLWPGSVVCVDPKGENAMLTADARSEGRNGYPQAVHVLDPFHAARIVNNDLRASFNPLWELMEPDPDGEDWGTPDDDDYEPAMIPVTDAVDEAAIIAASIIVDGDKGSTNPFWNTSAKRMITALILHVISNERFKGRRNLVTVRQLIMTGDEDLLAGAQVEHPELTNAPALMWNDIALNMAFDGVIHEDGAFIYDMMRNDPETYTGVSATAASHTEFLKSPKIRATLKRSSFRLEDLKLSKQGMTLYLCLPMRFMGSEHYRWLRMIIGLVTQQMEKTPGQCRSGHKVLMMLDEFTSLKRMAYLEEALTQYAGAGLKMFFAVQTLDRLKAVYPDAWETFVSQCGVKCFFNADDHYSRDYISKLVGETEVCIKNAGENTTDTETGGWSLMDTVGNSTGGGVSDGQGTSRQEGENTSWNNGEGGGSSQSRNSGRNGGSSNSHGHAFGEGESYGGGTGISQVAYKSLLRSLFGMGPGYKPEWTESSNTNWSKKPQLHRKLLPCRQSRLAEGEGSNTSASWNKGEGGGRNKSASVNDNHTVSTNYQNSRSQARGESGSKAHGSGKSLTEQWQRRPIFLPEEIGRFFAGQKDSDERYPGLALVLAGGDVSMVVRRINYHEDWRFVGLFNPHLDYEFKPLKPKDLPPVVALPAKAELPAPAGFDWRKLWRSAKWTAIGVTPFLLLGALAYLIGWRHLGYLIGGLLALLLIYFAASVMRAPTLTPDEIARQKAARRKRRALRLAGKGDYSAWHQLGAEETARTAKSLEPKGW